MHILLQEPLVKLTGRYDELSTFGQNACKSILELQTISMCQLVPLGQSSHV